MENVSPKSKASDSGQQDRFAEFLREDWSPELLPNLHDGSAPFAIFDEPPRGSWSLDRSKLRARSPKSAAGDSGG